MVKRKSAIDQAMKSIAAQQAAFKDLMTRPSAFDQAMKSIVTQQTVFNDLMIRPSAIDQAMKSIAAQQAALKDLSARPLAIEQAIKSMTLYPDSIGTMFDSVASIDIDESILDIDDSEFNDLFNDSANQLYKAPDSSSFRKIFKTLSPYVQYLLLFIFLQVIMPQINNISANLLTPQIESLLNGDESPDREKIKKIKRLPLILDEVTTKDLRFITGNNVRLRSAASTKAEILDELSLGQVVTILSKSRNWIEVMYEYNDGEIMHGWVFTRYTANFIR